MTILSLLPLVAALVVTPRDAKASERIEGRHGEIVFPPGRMEEARRILAVADRAWEATSRWSPDPGQPSRPFTILLPEDQDEFRLLTRGAIPEWGIGVAVPQERLIILRPVRDIREEVERDEVIEHEVAHLIVGAAVGEAEVPRWMHEGMAVFISRRWTLAQRWGLVTAMMGGHLIPLERLERGFPTRPEAAHIAYLESASVVEYLHAELGDSGLVRLLAVTRERRSLEAALIELGEWDLPRLEWEWREDLQKRYRSTAVLTLSFPLWGLLALLVLVGFVRRRRQLARQREEPPMGALVPDWKEERVE